jgi:hypothetical protein
VRNVWAQTAMNAGRGREEPQDMEVDTEEVTVGNASEDMEVDTVEVMVVNATELITVDASEEDLEDDVVEGFDQIKLDEPT